MPSLDGVAEIVSALSTKTRPSDLAPELVIKITLFFIRPLLLNAEDMIELQLLTSGRATNVVAEGRLVGVKLLQRRGFPYPPGSGVEGELLGFDKFMRYFYLPIVLGIGASGYLIQEKGLSPLLKAGPIFGIYCLHSFSIQCMSGTWLSGVAYGVHKGHEVLTERCAWPLPLFKAGRHRRPRRRRPGGRPGPAGGPRVPPARAAVAGGGRAKSWSCGPARPTGWSERVLSSLIANRG